jgi:glucoside 3-dehydrogenase (cytochrome c) hitch-hiker subunit
MAPSTEPAASSVISRREAIRRAALLAGVALSPAWLTAVDQAVRPAAQGSRLTPAHAAIAGAVADRILPRTDTPGAADVGVPAFIDLLYGEFMTPAERKMLGDGLDAVDAAAKAAHGAAFSTLTADRQDALLRTIARAEEGKDQGFFHLIRSATVLGYFTSEQVGRNVLHYDPVPGRYEGCIPIDQVGRRNWTT